MKVLETSPKVFWIVSSPLQINSNICCYNCICLLVSLPTSAANPLTATPDLETGWARLGNQPDRPIHSRRMSTLPPPSPNEACTLPDSSGIAFRFKYLEPTEYHVIRATVELPDVFGVADWEIGCRNRTDPTSPRNLASAETFDFATVTAHLHRTLIKMLALCLKHKDSKHDYWTYWNMYHHWLGYSIIVLIWINVFIGASIVEKHEWKLARIGVLGMLTIVVVTMEAWTWFKFIKGRE